MAIKEPLDGEHLIYQHFPLDGPHTEETTMAAGDALGALARYLCYALGPGNANTTLPWANSGYRLIGELRYALSAQTEIYHHIANRYNDFLDDPTLRHDCSNTPDTQTDCVAAHTAVHLAITSLDTAAYSTTTTSRLLGTAHTHIGHLCQDPLDGL